MRHRVAEVRSTIVFCPSLPIRGSGRSRVLRRRQFLFLPPRDSESAQSACSAFCARATGAHTTGPYYHHLQAVRDDGDWEAWVLYMLHAGTETSKETLVLIEAIRRQMSDYKHRLRQELPKIYSQDLLNNLFRHPYTRIEFMVSDLGITRQTASKYLETLASHGFVEKHQAGRSNYYINVPLAALFVDRSE